MRLSGAKDGVIPRLPQEALATGMVMPTSYRYHVKGADTARPGYSILGYPASAPHSVRIWAQGGVAVAEETQEIVVVDDEEQPLLNHPTN